MAKEDPYYHWAKQKLAKNCETIDSVEYDPIKNFQRDPSGYYVLIKVNFVTARIEVAICTKDHEVEKIFSGRKAQDIYYEIFQYEKKHKISWFQEKTHIAY